MPTGNCGDCKRWKTMEQMDSDTDSEVMGLHDPFVNRGSYRLCELTLFCMDEKDGAALATARDASGYLAGLFTRAEFGCVQFEE